MKDKDVFDAFRAAQGRDVLPTSLSSAELRGLSAGLRARSVFTARGTSAAFATKIKEVIDAISSGEMGENQAITALWETLQALGYSPENGFPEDAGDGAGKVPPAMRGSLQDLSSYRRLKLIIETQTNLMRGAGQQLRGMDPDRLSAFPCWELVRMIPARVPRDWEARWLQVGGEFYQGRMIAPKGDAVWGELGTSFPDSLDVDYPPFAFNSGMGWEEVDEFDADDLGVKSTTDMPWETFHRQVERPRVIDGPLPLPTPRLSAKDIGADFVTVLAQQVDAVIDDEGDMSFDTILLEGLQKADIAYGREPRTHIDQYKQ